jgi:hypothetical protein
VGRGLETASGGQRGKAQLLAGGGSGGCGLRLHAFRSRVKCDGEVVHTNGPGTPHFDSNEPTLHSRGRPNDSDWRIDHSSCKQWELRAL